MYTALTEEARQGGRSVLALAAVVLLSAALCCMAPRATNIFLPLTALAALWTVRRNFARHWQAREWMRDPLQLAALALMAFIAMSAIWSLDPAATAKQAVVVAALLAMTWLGVISIRLLDGRTAAAARRALLAGIAIGLAFLLFELLSDQAIARAVHNLFPFLRPDSNKDFFIENGRVVGIEKFELNRNLALMLLMLWPALFVAQDGLKGAARLVPATALIGGAGLAAWLSVHETGKIAIIAAAGVFLLSHLSPSLIRRAIIVLWCAGFVLAVPAASFFYRTAELHEAERLPLSARARIIIWGVTAEQIPKNPVLGIGMRSTRVLQDRIAASAAQPENHVIPRIPGRHSHNIFLQSWLELGLAGAVIVMLGGVALLRRMSRFPAAMQPAANAFAATGIVVASFSWGMWQSWLVAGFGLAIVLLVAAARCAGGQRA